MENGERAGGRGGFSPYEMNSMIRHYCQVWTCGLVFADFCIRFQATRRTTSVQRVELLSTAQLIICKKQIREEKENLRDCVCVLLALIIRCGQTVISNSLLVAQRSNKA